MRVASYRGQILPIFKNILSYTLRRFILCRQISYYGSNVLRRFSYIIVNENSETLLKRYIYIYIKLFEIYNFLRKEEN